jgi:hypothetical protein
MEELNDSDYEHYFPAVLAWLRRHVHDDIYPYTVLDLRDSRNKMIELLHPQSTNMRCMSSSPQNEKRTQCSMYFYW